MFAHNRIPDGGYLSILMAAWAYCTCHQRRLRDTYLGGPVRGGLHRRKLHPAANIEAGGVALELDGFRLYIHITGLVIGSPWSASMVLDPPCTDGVDGVDGIDGVDGAPGMNGVDGAPGRDGVDGAPSRGGVGVIDGVYGARGRDGVDGADAGMA